MEVVGVHQWKNVEKIIIIFFLLENINLSYPYLVCERMPVWLGVARQTYKSIDQRMYMIYNGQNC